MPAGTLDGVIEQMCDDELGIISPVRVYVCTVNQQGDPLPHARLWAASEWVPPRGYAYTTQLVTLLERHLVDDEVICGRCAHGPVLWDHWRQQTYVLTPYVIIEEEF